MSRPVTATNEIAIPQAGDYHVDPRRSTVTFTTRHLFGLAAVRGSFELREGHIYVADELGGSSARAVISAASVRTRNPMRDTAVRSTFLDADHHPDIAFVSTGLDQVDGRWVLRGSLKVCGHARPIDVLVDSVRTAGRELTVRASATVDRYAFGVTAMKGMAGRSLRLQLDITADRT